jgi:malonyl-CoA O-methyltransferase
MIQQANHEAIKRRIQASFSKSARRYDVYAKVQKEVAAMILERIDPLLSGGGLTLDLGCGTGYLSLPLLQMGIGTVGIDFSSSMINVARRKAEERGLEHDAFHVADSASLPFKKNTFELVVSSLMYQWVWGLEEGFQEVSRVLKPDGFFAFTILGKDSLKELRISYKEASERLERDGLPPLMRFPEADSVKNAMMISGFEEIKIDKVLFIKPYNSLFHLLKMLKNIGASNPMDGKDNTFSKKSFLELMDKIYKEKFSENGGVGATYEILLCSGRKVLI